jgi:hypothetical protein
MVVVLLVVVVVAVVVAGSNTVQYLPSFFFNEYKDLLSRLIDCTKICHFTDTDVLQKFCYLYEVNTCIKHTYSVAVAGQSFSATVFTYHHTTT